MKDSGQFGALGVINACSPGGGGSSVFVPREIVLCIKNGAIFVRRGGVKKLESVRKLNILSKK